MDINENVRRGVIWYFLVSLSKIKWLSTPCFIQQANNFSDSFEKVTASSNNPCLRMFIEPFHKRFSVNIFIDKIGPTGRVGLFLS
ncbi:hypothetical protein ACLB1M_29020 [Escherichia coli]